MEQFFKKFKLTEEQEDFEIIFSNIDKGVVFKGTNLWVLIFAIFVASLGLNVNSTAVIIGAMLISPLMGPIMGLGMGIGIYDIALLRKALYNYLVATGVALVTSTVFFSLSPLSDAHSEILARTSPNIYDVMIALFGGLAGIVATASKNKGNVIPGVAIATALMPPLCTAGYGLATLQLQYFFGAFYLYVINTVFIAFATFVFVRFLNFPAKDLHDVRLTKRAHHIIWFIVIITLLPSMYFGYDIVQQEKFNHNANNFIQYEAHFTDDYLLSKKVDAKQKSITLVYGGKEITEKEIELLKSKRDRYQLNNAKIEIKQGFAFLSESQNSQTGAQYDLLSKTLESKAREYDGVQKKLDSIKNQEKLSRQIFSELQAQYPTIKTAFIQPANAIGDSGAVKRTFLVLLEATGNFSRSDKKKIEKWMMVRLQQKEMTLVFK